jgi:hypothetical protein
VPVSVHLLILLAGEDSGPAQPDNFWIWPNDNYNVTAIEAYGTLALAIISVVIAGLVCKASKLRDKASKLRGKTSELRTTTSKLR